MPEKYVNQMFLDVADIPEAAEFGPGDQIRLSDVDVTITEKKGNVLYLTIDNVGGVGQMPEPEAETMEEAPTPTTKPAVSALMGAPGMMGRGQPPA